MELLREYGLPPILGKDPEILILGSFPSKMSLERQQYYANPHNQFWKIMSDLLKCDSVEDIDSCIEVLKDHHIAVWDVIASRSYQKGSMDSDITDPVFNDIPGFICNHRTIRYVGTNGGKAWECFRKSVNGIHFGRTFISERLPSTSPAYAAISYEQKLSCWQDLLSYIS